MIELEQKLEKITENYIMRPATIDDIEEAVDLMETTSRHIIGASEVSLDDIKAEWSLPMFDLEQSTRVIIDPEPADSEGPDGKLVGYIEVWDIDRLPVDIFVWGCVHPAYEDLGIGTRLMHWSEKRASQAIDRVPDDVQIVMTCRAYHHYPPTRNLFRSLRMAPVRHYLEMAIDLDQELAAPRWPAGISVRTFAGFEEAREVLRAVRDAFRDHWGYVEQPFEESYKRWLHFMRNKEDFDPSLWFLAVEGDEIVGVSLCSPKSEKDHEMGWINTLGVRRPWRRRGIGLALLNHSFAEFQERGSARVGLGVDADSLTQATRLYEKAGMSPIPKRQMDLYRKIVRPGRDISRQEL